MVLRMERRGIGEAALGEGHLLIRRMSGRGSCDEMTLVYLSKCYLYLSLCCTYCCGCFEVSFAVANVDILIEHILVLSQARAIYFIPLIRFHNRLLS